MSNKLIVSNDFNPNLKRYRTLDSFLTHTRHDIVFIFKYSGKLNKTTKP